MIYYNFILESGKWHYPVFDPFVNISLLKQQYSVLFFLYLRVQFLVQKEM